MNEKIYNCPSCSTEIKGNADSCPVCHTPIIKEQNENEYNENKLPQRQNLNSKQVCPFCTAKKDVVSFFETSNHKFILYLLSFMFGFPGYLYYKKHANETVCPVCGKKRGEISFEDNNQSIDTLLKLAKITDGSAKGKAFMFGSFGTLSILISLLFALIGIIFTIASSGLWAWIVSAIFALLGILSFTRIGKALKSNKNEKNKFLGNAVKLLAKEKGGNLTVQNVSRILGISNKEAEEVLNILATEDGVKVELTQQGEIVYQFGDVVVNNSVEEQVDIEETKEKLVSNQ